MAAASSRAGFAAGSTSGPLCGQRVEAAAGAAPSTSAPMSSAGHDAEQREGRVAATDVGAVLEHVGEAALAGQAAELGPGIGDRPRSGPAAGRAPRPTRGGCASRSWSRTSTTPGAACAPGRHVVGDPRDGGRVGGVEHVQARAARGRLEGAGEHLGEEARAAHAHHEHVVDAVDQRVAPRRRAPGGRPSTSATTGIQPSRSASSVGSSRQSVWSPAKSRRDRVAVDEVGADGSRRRRRSRVTARPTRRDRGRGVGGRARPISSTTSSVWARPGNSTS